MKILHIEEPNEKGRIQKTLCGKFVPSDEIASAPEAVTCKICKEEWEYFNTIGKQI